MQHSVHLIQTLVNFPPRGGSFLWQYFWPMNERVENAKLNQNKWQTFQRFKLGSARWLKGALQSEVKQEQIRIPNTTFTVATIIRSKHFPPQKFIHIMVTFMIRLFFFFNLAPTKIKWFFRRPKPVLLSNYIKYIYYIPFLVTLFWRVYN